MLNEAERSELLRMYVLNPREYMQRYLSIKTKAGRIIPFRHNAAQRRLMDVIEREQALGKPVRIIILKARQMGFSTLAQGLIFARTATRPNRHGLVAAHQEDSTAMLFGMSRVFYETLPQQLQVMLKTSNVQELRFENPTRDPLEKNARPGLRSRIRCVTAGGRGVGRSDTFQSVHLSELAFWSGDPKETLAGIMQAVPSSPDTLVIIESTANGYNAFKELWDAAVAGESDFVPVFFPWYEHPEYRMTTPRGAVWSAEELELQSRFDLSFEQLTWRRWCIRNNCAGDIDRFKQEYPATPSEAFIHTGNPVFDAEAVAAWRELAPAPIVRGTFTYTERGEAQEAKLDDIAFTESASGEVRIYKHPQAGKPYVIGGDTAGEGSDYFAACVLDNTTGEQVAVLHHRYDEDVYAKQAYALGVYYNNALIAIENNYSTYPTMTLERLNYPKLYVRESVDTYTHRLKKSYGFMTTTATRPVILAGLVEVARDDLSLIVDNATLGEMLTFVYDERRKPCAMAGAHDDLVMATAIAHYIRPQQDMTLPKDARQPRVKWTADMYEDYYRASDADKQYLLDKWGDPF